MSKEPEAKMSRTQAEAVARAIAYGLHDSLREDLSPAPARLYRIKPPVSNIIKDGGLIEIQVFHVDIAERNAVVEAMHRLNRRGIVSNEDIDYAVGSGYSELTELHYPSTKRG